MTDESPVDTDRDTHCPNCGKEGYGNYGLSRQEFEEWDCKNDNCRVSVFKVRVVATGNERSNEGDER